LVVIPEGNLLLAFAFAFAFAFAVAAVFLVVIPEGNLLLAFAVAFAFAPPRSAAILPPMHRDYDFFVYILSSRSRNLYIGITNSLTGRLSIHRERHPGAHTAKYNVLRLVYYEHFQYVLNAIAREKQLKHWTRAQKIALIESINPTWEDLSLKFGTSIVAPQN
jgi:putative endonuclease